MCHLHVSMLLCTPNLGHMNLLANAVARPEASRQGSGSRGGRLHGRTPPPPPPPPPSLPFWCSPHRAANTFALHTASAPGIRCCCSPVRRRRIALGRCRLRPAGAAPAVHRLCAKLSWRRHNGPLVLHEPQLSRCADRRGALRSRGRGTAVSHGVAQHRLSAGRREAQGGWSGTHHDQIM